MTREETAEILAVLKAAYPESFKAIKMRDGLAMIGLWQNMFENDSYDIVKAAVMALIATRKVGYSPTVGEVKEKIQSFRERGNLTEQAAWALVAKACRNGLYGYREEFYKLPPEVQRAVGSPEQLHAWAAMDADTVESVVASNFMRSYRVFAAREMEREMLPESVRNVIGPLADGMKMIGGGTDADEGTLQRV